MIGLSALDLRNAVRLWGSMWPILVICGLLVMWVLIVIVCLNFGPVYQSFLGEKILLH